MDIWATFAAGMLAGLGIAVPMGAVSVLIMREGLVAGFRTALAAALAVGSVDVAYCAVALALGAVVPVGVADALGPVPAVVAGVILAGIGGFGLWGLRRGPGWGSAGGESWRDRPVRTPAQVFAVFIAMTLLNPVTLVYFAALTAVLPGLLGAGASAWWFLPGVAVGSLSWQVLLAGAASLAGRRVGPRGRLAVSAVGYGIVVLLGVLAVVGGVAASPI